MNRYAFKVRMTPAARELLRPDEALVLDWHGLAVCCAGVGELGLYAMKEKSADKRKGLARLKGGTRSTLREPSFHTWQAARSASMPGKSWAFDTSRPTYQRISDFGRLWDDCRRSWKRRCGFEKSHLLPYPVV